MNTFVKSLAAVTVLSLPGVAIAQSTDAAYCKALSVSYHKYVSSALTGQNPEPPPVEVQYAHHAVPGRQHRGGDSCAGTEAARCQGQSPVTRGGSRTKGSDGNGKGSGFQVWS